MKTTGYFISIRASLFVLILTLFSFLWVMETPAYAQSTNACADDIAKFCKNVKAGEGRIADCLKEHENELSAACKNKMENTKRRMQRINDVCKDDVDKFCKDVKPGGGRILNCLKEHENEVSSKCKAKIAKEKKMNN